VHDTVEVLITTSNGVDTWVRYEPAASRCIVEPKGGEPEIIGLGELSNRLPTAARMIREALEARRAGVPSV
jgi:hypothetical protein